MKELLNFFFPSNDTGMNYSKATANGRGDHAAHMNVLTIFFHMDENAFIREDIF